jgi:uncharacterized protein (TIGR03663 family)
MNRWVIRALLLILAAGALWLRLPQLDQRPLHNDESVNAFKIRDLWEQGVYKYDPNEFHGPTLHYATLPFLWLSPAKTGADLSDGRLRLAPVFFGVGLILLLGLMADGLGRIATITAGILLAISPAFVFYSRYFIHEMLFVFFGALMLGAGWRYVVAGKLAWAVVCGLGMGLMYATKETFVFHVGAMAVAALGMAYWRAKSTGQRITAQPGWNWRHWLLALLAALVVAEVFFTSFFTNARGPLDALLTYERWFTHAGKLHDHPWHFYFQRLFWYQPARSPLWTEGLVGLLALVGTGAAFFRKELPGVNLRLARFLAIYTFVLTAIYAAIPYKTTWCMLGFYHGMILLASVGAAFLLAICRPWWAKVAVGLLLLTGCGQLGYQAWRACHPVEIKGPKARPMLMDFSADPRNPYTYSQTRPNLLELVKKVQAISKVHPAGNRMLIKVLCPEIEGPLPWYLRQFQQVGWWSEMPADPYAPVIIVSTNLNALLDEKSNKEYLMVGLFELRPRVFLELYVEFELWKRYVETLPKNREE